MKYTLGVMVTIVVTIIFFALYYSYNASPSGGTVFKSQTSNAGGVTVTIKPQSLSENITAWNFEVTLNTHAIELTADLVEAVVLIDESGNEYEPTGWKGDSLGGHHREGMLSFQPLDPLPRAITLLVRNIGEIKERNFSWQLQ